MLIRRPGSALALVGSVLFLAAAACDQKLTDPDLDVPKATRTNFLVFATYPGAQLSVYANDALAGTLNSTWSGSTACGTLLSAGPSSVVTIPAFVSQTYRLKAVAPNGRGVTWSSVTVDDQMVREATCYAFRVPSAP